MVRVAVEVEAGVAMELEEVAKFVSSTMGAVEPQILQLYKDNNRKVF